MAWLSDPTEFTQSDHGPSLSRCSSLSLKLALSGFSSLKTEDLRLL